MSHFSPAHAGKPHLIKYIMHGGSGPAGIPGYAPGLIILYMFPSVKCSELDMETFINYYLSEKKLSSLRNPVYG